MPPVGIAAFGAIGVAIAISTVAAIRNGRISYFLLRRRIVYGYDPELLREPAELIERAKTPLLFWLAVTIRFAAIGMIVGAMIIL